MKSEVGTASVISCNELQVILEWMTEKIRNQHGDIISIQKDFYRLVGSKEWFFEFEKTDNIEESFGSFIDEIDLLRKSVLERKDDLPAVVMERMAYLLLYLAYRAENSQSSALENEVAGTHSSARPSTRDAV